MQPMLYLDNAEGKKEVLTITIGINESEILAVNERTENRGVKDILIICADGLTGIVKKLISAASNRIPEVYCPSGKKHPEIRSGQGTEKPLLQI